MDEFCDIYNINSEKTGKIFTRGEDLKEGEFQLVTSIWVINEKSQILIQKRASIKTVSPNMWATHGGGVSASETSFYAAIREAYEEIGIMINSTDVRPLTKIIGNKLIMHSYIVVQEFNIKAALLQVEEVSDLQWVSVEKLEHMVKNNCFFNYQELPYLINFINNLK